MSEFVRGERMLLNLPYKQRFGRLNGSNDVTVVLHMHLWQL